MMISIKHFKIYLGTESWGWNMYGIGWKSYWFLGFTKSECGTKFYTHPLADKDAERWKFVNGENYYAVCKYNDSPYGASYIPVDVADIDKAMGEV